MVLMEHEKEITKEAIIAIHKAYVNSSNKKEYASMEQIYFKFRESLPKTMHEFLSEKQNEWNIYIEEKPYDLESYITNLFEGEGFRIPSLENVNVIVNAMKLSYTNGKRNVFNGHQVIVW
jgi:hypothetical protein